MADLYLPFGPLEGKPINDDFKFEDVKESECKAFPSRNIGRYLIERAEVENTKYLCVCVPAYNEDLDELLKTLVSLMENFDFMIKKVRNYTKLSIPFLTVYVECRLDYMMTLQERPLKKSLIPFAQ